MGTVKYNKVKALKAQRSASIKSAKIADGTKLEVLDLIPNAASTETLNRDELLCQKPDGKRLRIPVREFMNMSAADGAKLFHESEAEGEIIFPSAIEIVKGTNRTSNRSGQEETIYPIQAYVDGARQIQELDFNFEKLLASGLRENHGLDPVQNYEIKTVF